MDRFLLWWFFYLWFKYDIFSRRRSRSHGLRFKGDQGMTAFGTDVLKLTVDLLPLLLALALTRLARSAAHAALVILNLCLFMELLTTFVDPGYRFVF